MKKNFLYTVLGLMGIMGALSIGVVDAKSETIYITGFDGDTSDALIQVNDQNWDDLEIYFLKDDGGTAHYTFMDRNLGASEVRNFAGNNTGSFGYHYQRGNNYGFKSCYTNYCTAFPGGEMPTTSLVSKDVWSVYVPSKYARNMWHRISNGTYTWMGSGSWNDGIWGSTTNESRQGPCPKGYYIPTNSDWSNLKTAWGKSTISSSNGVDLAESLLLSFAGYRKSNDMNVSLVDSQAMLWSSSPSPNNVTESKAIQISKFGNITLNNDEFRSYGRSVRCMKILPNTPEFTIDLKGGNRATVAFTGTLEDGKFTKLGTPKRSNSTFSGWYTKDGISDGNWGNKLGVGSGVVSNIYAKWSCPEGEIDDGSACVIPNPYQIKFEAGEGTGIMDNQSFTYGVSQKLTANAFTRTGYTFSGWADGITAYTDKQNVKNLTGTDGAIITFTAQWTPITYTIDFSGNATNVSGTQAPINAEYDSGDMVPESSFTRTGYTFTGWNTESDGSGTGYVTGDTLKNLTTTGGDVVTLYAQWKANTYTVTFDVNGGNALTPNTGAVTYDTGYGTLPTPSRNGYSFNGWFTAATNGTKITASTIVLATGDHTLYAQWTQNPVSGGSSSGGGSSGGGGSSKAKTSNDSTKSTDSQTGSKVDSSTKASDTEDNTQGSSAKASEGQNQGKTYSEEFTNAYEFAHSKGITTMPTIEQANMEGPLTRIAMAKMLSYYAINVLGQKPDETRVNKFNDVSDKMNVEYNNAVTLAYQLGIMGINMPKNKFRPNDLVTRAEFATALSRMLYKIADGKDKYYSTHMAKLMEEKIITNDNPNLQELRGYVMIMLMRSAK